MFTHSRYTVALLLAASFTAPAAASVITTTSPKTAAPASTLPTAALPGPFEDGTRGGFGMTLEKKKLPSVAANSNVKARDDFNSDIVDNWLVKMNFGTPPQLLELSLDLGSDGVVVESTLMPKDMQTVDYPIFNPNDSTTAHQLDNLTWEATYGGFSLVGDIYTDVVTLGESTFKNITMEVVTGQPTGSVLTTASGIFGLSAHLFASGASSPVPSFLGSVVGQLADLVFTLWFNNTLNDGSTVPDGQINFGFIDDTLYTGDIAYTPLTNPEGSIFWEIEIAGIGAADPVTGDLLFSNMTKFTTILDTGNGQTEIPLAALWGWYGGMPGSILDDGGHCWDYVCSIGDSLPDMVFFIGDQAVVAPRNTYGWWENMNPKNGEPNVNYCTGHVRPSDYFSGGQNSIGQDILDGLFLVLDYQNKRVGFANSTVMTMDSSFSIPGVGSGSGSGSGSSSGTCSYTNSDETIKPSITGCTGEKFAGTCSQIAVNISACTPMDS
ncbi:MAG: Type I transmembrane sorting receptor [Claussenomyces sp. TS43310]|nr:MAG: Type I transmembrane sorting receptor [Claussenomyces sp. TS43310]